MSLKSKSRFKKRYIALALIAVDIFVLPIFGVGAAAHVKEQLSSLAPQQVANVRLTHKPGRSLYLVTSNAPFVISAKHAKGENRVAVQQSGVLFGMHIGAVSQMPGPADHCAIAAALDETIIYRAGQQTIAKRGGTLEQSVIVMITHDRNTLPEFTFKIASEAAGIITGAACNPPENGNA
ncbi:MAG: hypothetical protein ACPGVT_03700 [Maricaulaceae bacterium]